MSPRTTLQMLQEWKQLDCVFKAPLADHQAFDFAPNELFGIEARIPWFYKKRAEDDFENVGVRGRLGVRFIRFCGLCRTFRCEGGPVGGRHCGHQGEYGREEEVEAQVKMSSVVKCEV
jgi:hypothetical protein